MNDLGQQDRRVCRPQGYTLHIMQARDMNWLVCPHALTERPLANCSLALR